MDIAEVRSKIDDLDQRMLDLFLERMSLMGEVASREIGRASCRERV